VKDYAKTLEEVVGITGGFNGDMDGFAEDVALYTVKMNTGL
jgi:hypothetical protein